MASVIPTSTVEYAGVPKSTAPHYFKGASDLTFRRRLWLAMLKKYGLIESNANSYSRTWTLEVSQPDVRQYGDGGDLTFAQHDPHEQLTIDIRGYTATDRLSMKQKLMNSGDAQITDEYKEKSKRLAKRVQQVLCAELYIDGNASKNENRFHGIESFLADDGNTVVGDMIAKPSDTYAGQSTAPGTFGGSWSTDRATSPNATLATDWPYGQGDSEYDAISPLLVNIGHNGWPGGGQTWKDNCEYVMRFARVTQVARGAKGENQQAPYLHMLSTELYTDTCTYFTDRNRQLVPVSESSNLGFGDVLNFEGDMIQYEYDVPNGTGYGIAPTQMELFHLGGMLMNPIGPEWAITKLGYLYLVFVFGNLRFQPKFFSKYKSYASS